MVWIQPQSHFSIVRLPCGQYKGQKYHRWYSMQGDSLWGSSKVIINHNNLTMEMKLGSTVCSETLPWCLPAQFERDVVFLMSLVVPVVTCHLTDYMWAATDPVLASSATQLSPHIWRYVITNFGFQLQITVWFVFIKDSITWCWSAIFNILVLFAVFIIK
jgi:hypothetical protein